MDTTRPASPPSSPPLPTAPSSSRSTSKAKSTNAAAAAHHARHCTRPADAAGAPAAARPPSAAPQAPIQAEAVPAVLSPRPPQQAWERSVLARMQHFGEPGFQPGVVLAELLAEDRGRLLQAAAREPSFLRVRELAAAAGDVALLQTLRAGRFCFQPAGGARQALKELGVHAAWLANDRFRVGWQHAASPKFTLVWNMAPRDLGAALFRAVNDPAGPFVHGWSERTMSARVDAAGWATILHTAARYGQLGAFNYLWQHYSYAGSLLESALEGRHCGIIRTVLEHEGGEAKRNRLEDIEKTISALEGTIDQQTDAGGEEQQMRALRQTIRPYRPEATRNARRAARSGRSVEKQDNDSLPSSPPQPSEMR